MTIRDLMKAVPEEFWDSMIEIYLPQLRPGEEGECPLINVTIDQVGTRPIRIILEADYD